MSKTQFLCQELKREVRTDFSLSPEPLGAREGLQELEKNWAEIMGSGYDIIVSKCQDFSNSIAIHNYDIFPISDKYFQIVKIFLIFEKKINL